jgi:hypothetical protein
MVARPRGAKRPYFFIGASGAGVRSAHVRRCFLNYSQLGRSRDPD